MLVCVDIEALFHCAHTFTAAPYARHVESCKLQNNCILIDWRLEHRLAGDKTTNIRASECYSRALPDYRYSQSTSRRAVH
jgi:hypothetical protein